MDISITDFNTTLSGDPTEIPALRAEKITRYEMGTMAKVADSWKKIAQMKASQTTSPSEQSLFLSCSWISDCVTGELTFPSTDSEAYVCKDERGNEQAFIIISMKVDEVYVEYLVTNPINIRSSLNDREEKKVKGAGTCLIQKMEEIAISVGKSAVSLNPVESAVGFYEKNGFVFEDVWGKMIKLVSKVKEASIPALAA